MKKLLLFIFILLGLLFVGCNQIDDNTKDNNVIDDGNDNNQGDNTGDNSGDNSEDNLEIPEGLTKEEYKQIASDFAKYANVLERDVKIANFYGKYNDKYAIWIDAGSVYYTEAEENYTIAGVPFSFPNGHEIYIYYNGSFSFLQYAYKEDVISPSDVVSIYNKYKNKQVVCSIDRLVVNIIDGDKLLLECRYNTLINSETITQMINQKLGNSNKYKVYTDSNKTKEIEETSFSERMEVYADKDKRVIVIVDYAHNKLSFEKLYESTIKEYPKREIITVFGCPGGHAVNRRKDLGELSGKYSDISYLTTEDPREEDPVEICKEISMHIKKVNGKYKIVEDRGEAIKRAIFEAKPNSVILITGKGNETRQKIGKEYVTVPTDVQYVKEFLKEYEKDNEEETTKK